MTSYFKGTDNSVDPTHQGINVLKHPFRITIHIYGRIEGIYGAWYSLCVFWEYIVGSPNPGHFLIVDVLDCSD